MHRHKHTGGCLPASLHDNDTIQAGKHTHTHRGQEAAAPTHWLYSRGGVELHNRKSRDNWGRFTHSRDTLSFLQFLSLMKSAAGVWHTSLTPLTSQFQKQKYTKQGTNKQPCVRGTWCREHRITVEASYWHLELWQNRNSSKSKQELLQDFQGRSKILQKPAGPSQPHKKTP